MKKDVRYDGIGPLKKMAEADGWVMARRPGAMPILMTLKEWDRMIRSADLHVEVQADQSLSVSSTDRSSASRI